MILLADDNGGRCCFPFHLCHEAEGAVTATANRPLDIVGRYAATASKSVSGRSTTDCGSLGEQLFRRLLVILSSVSMILLCCW